MPFTATTACSLASILTPSSMAFILPRTTVPTAIVTNNNDESSSSIGHLHLYPYLWEGASSPPPHSGKGSSSSSSFSVNATLINEDDKTDIINANDEADFVGAGTLGDIMAGSVSTNNNNTDTTTKQNPIHQQQQQELHPSIKDGLVTKDGGQLNVRFAGCNFTPLERIALTANGNLQRIFSSYYDAPVHVHVDYCGRRKTSTGDESNIPQIGFDVDNISDEYMRFDPIIYENGANNNGDDDDDDDDAIWDRVVSIQVHDQTICRATSVISVKSPLCVKLIDNGSVGLGQMFRYLNKLPTFSLLDAGRIGKMGMEVGTTNEFVDVEIEYEGGMWRTYELTCEEMTCLIHEEFRCDSWDVVPETRK
mmetsp:Transcript_25736/g.49032  ORF Transcript_25736/g.49032 Transcript_25736/m.49032 type:complete len:365 (+) Transcript_25736:135-1229(+)